MKLINKSPRNYIAFDVILEAGKVIEVNDSKTANILLTQPDVEKYVDVKDVEKLEKELKALKEKEAKKEVKKETKKETKK